VDCSILEKESPHQPPGRTSLTPALPPRCAASDEPTAPPIPVPQHPSSRVIQHRAASRGIEPAGLRRLAEACHFPFTRARRNVLAAWPSPVHEETSRGPPASPSRRGVQQCPGRIHEQAQAVDGRRNRTHVQNSLRFAHGSSRQRRSFVGCLVAGNSRPPGSSTGRRPHRREP
jgi:hypothetical protein